MKKVVLTIVAMMIIIRGVQYIITKNIDTKYAIEYAEIFGSYDIDKVDKYLNKKTSITYKGITKSYEELRNNVINAFNEKKYEMPSGSSYGNGNDHFVNSVQNIGIQVYVISNHYSSDYVEMEIERNWFFFYKIKSLKSNDSFFNYLFFGSE